MTLWQKSLGVKLAVMVTGILIPLLLGSFLWLELRSENNTRNEQDTRAVQVGESLVATLSSIMLSGNADIAHFWLQRVASVPGVESAKIFRTDGTEAFQDRTTLDRVNTFLGEQRFAREALNKPATVPTDLLAQFNKASQGSVEIARTKNDQHLEYMAPIHAEDACMGCHGYDSNPIRGILLLGLTTDSLQIAATETKRDMLNMLILIVMLLALAIWLIMRKQVLIPLEALTNIASNIRAGDLSSKIELNRYDELGVVTSTFDLLVHDLKQRIADESARRQRQEAITDAVIHLGKETTSTALWKDIAAISMRITNAHYVMISYVENGIKQFVSLGISPENEAKITHAPEGNGLLGLLWKEGKTVRTEHIADHPASCGFPTGHPLMEPFLGTPMRFEDKILGTIYLSKDSGGKPFSIEDENALVLLASASAVALANTQNLERVKQANAELESRVLERTRELDRTNSQLKTHEIELEMINEELVSANKAKDQFLANTSHELRTPLNAIIGFSELLTDTRSGTLTSKQQRYVKHVHNSGKRLLTIINDLLDISKIEAGMMEIHETSFSPVEFGQQVIAELRPLAGSKDIELMLITSIEQETHIQTDRDKLHQILVNLIGNAIKFTPSGGMVEVGLSLDENSQKGVETTFSCYVKDNGIGIPAEDQEKIFLPFTQSNGGLDRTHGGTGLGLTLSRRMIQMLGGNLHLKSELDIGSTFYIDQPVIVSSVATDTEFDAKADDNSRAQPFTPAPTEEVTPHAGGHQPLIMIVDENSARADTAEEMFSREGYQIIQTDIDSVEVTAAISTPFLIILGVSDNSDKIYDQMRQLKRSEITNRTPTILMAGDQNDLHFSTGGTIGQIQKGSGSNHLLEMVSHYKVHAITRLSAPTVLVVDDDASVRDYLKEILAPEGYHILLASNGREGIRLAIERDPDLIILDLMMPGTTGFEVVEKLKQHPTAGDIPVVIFTAKDLSREEALLLGQDVERILIKGISKKGDVLNQLHKLELLYPVQAKLIDVKFGCFNLRYIERRLQHEIARSIRYSHNFSLIAWQMDGYESYCTTHGKRWGEAALKASIATVQSIIRKGDVLSRLDSNSFILLLPGITTEGTRNVSEKIRLRIGHQRLPLPGDETGKLTASLSVVASDEGHDSQDLMTMLKQRLGTAVAEGGNRTIMED